MKRIAKWVAGGLAVLVAVVVLVVGFELMAFNSAANAEHAIPPLEMVASTDSAVLARGRHVAESFGGCTGCHGPDLGGEIVADMGPVGVMRATNITRGRGGTGGSYTDGEMARAIRHGVRADGRSLKFMPADELNWIPDSDLHAVVSYVRSVPDVDREMAPAEVKPLGRLLNQFGVMPVLSAELALQQGTDETVPMPEPTARYGEFLARSCRGCHGLTFAGGPMPGAPSDLPKPANLTPHETGLAGWTEAQFLTAINTGVRPDGRQLDSFMPISATSNMNDVEKRALWEYVKSLPPLPFGTR